MKKCPHINWTYKSMDIYGMVPFCMDCNKVQIPVKYSWVPVKENNAKRLSKTGKNEKEKG
jgi:hypothetical protein